MTHTGHLSLDAGSCKEWMRRSFFPLSVHYRDARPYLIVRQVQAELSAQDRSEFGFVFQQSSCCFTGCVPHS
jgi:hypothetical protein